MPHRLLGRRLVALVVVLLTCQISGAAVWVVQGLGVRGRDDASTCCCCRRGAPGHCPYCCRTPRISAGCQCGCQHHDTAVAPTLNIEAIVPAAASVFADLSVTDTPAVAGPGLAECLLVPPSPPPWLVRSPLVVEHPVSFARA